MSSTGPRKIRIPNRASRLGDRCTRSRPMPLTRPVAVSAAAAYTEPSETTYAARDWLPQMDAAFAIRRVARSIEYSEQQLRPRSPAPPTGPSTYNVDPSAPANTPFNPDVFATSTRMRPDV